MELDLNEDLKALINQCREEAPDLAPLKDMGIDIPDEAIVRKALVLGLKAWVAGQAARVVRATDVAPAPAPQPAPQPVPVPESRIFVPSPEPAQPAQPQEENALLAQLQQMQKQLAQLQSAPPAPAEPEKTQHQLDAEELLSSAADLSERGMPVNMGAREEPPANWQPWPVTSPIPADEKEIHHHYGAAGWGRWQATTPRGPVTVYWSQYAAQRGKAPATPYMQVLPVDGYGIAHVLPPDYKYRQMGADGAEMREKMAGHVPEAIRTGAASVVEGS